jgi:hypothetical protein
MSAPLENEYRKALRWYPNRWRTRNEDAVVGTLLDVAEDRGESSPSKDDLRNLRARGIQERLGWVGRALTASARDRLSLIALGTGLAISLWGLVFSTVDAAQLRGNLLPSWMGGDPLNLYAGTTFGPFASLDCILFALWIAAFVTALIGLPRVTRVLLVATIPAAAAAGPVSGALGMPDHPSYSFLVLLCLFAILALLGTPESAARWRLSVGISGMVATLVLSAAVLRSHIGLFLYPGMNFHHGAIGTNFPLVGWICVAAPALVILCIALARWSWAAVIALSAVPWIAVYVVANSFSPSPWALVFWIGTVVVLAGIAAVISLRTRHLRIRITVTRR